MSKLSIRETLKRMRFSDKNQYSYKNREKFIHSSDLEALVYKQTRVKNIFDTENISQTRRDSAFIQNKVLKQILKMTTPKYSVNCKNFKFNSKSRYGWIIAEFDVNEDLSDDENIKNIDDFILERIDMRASLIALSDDIIIVGFLFPNAPTTLEKDRLKKYNYFVDIRKALIHTINANWDVTKKNYNQLKSYKNIIDDPFYITGNVFELGMFTKVLTDYKKSARFDDIIKQQNAFGGQKAGVTKRKYQEKKRQRLTKNAIETKKKNASKKLDDTVIHILKTEKFPNLTIKHIVEVSKELFDKGLGNKTVAKYLPKIKEKYNIA